jgi:hypothetical protein
MTPDGDERAKGVDLPSWWLEKVRSLVDERGENLTELGASLADAVGRSEAWDHSTVSRFLRNKNTTVPMAEAFATLLGLPRPFFVPRSMDEALSLQQVVKRYDGPKLSPEQVRRLTIADQVVEAAEEEVRDQTRGVISKDEGAHRGGRTGRTTRGRSSSS